VNTSVKYGGISAIPSDHLCQDGDLSLAVNLINEEKELRPILAPRVLMQLGVNQKVEFVHSTQNYTHYIVVDSSTPSVYWTDGEVDEEKNPTLTLLCSFSGAAIIGINAIGNTLLVLTESDINYFLWQNSEYVSLGTHIPDVELSFGLVGHPRLYSLSDEDKTFGTISVSISGDELASMKISDDKQDAVTSSVMAVVNKFISTQCTEKGRFCHPFLVRYALRLYDGTLINHSAPVLMCPATLPAPVVSFIEGVWFDVMLVSADLDYEVLNNTAAAELKKWSDIVKSIDVFVSKPLYMYDQSGKIETIGTSGLSTKFIGNPKFTDAETIACTSVGVPFDPYMEITYSDIYQICYSKTHGTPSLFLDLPKFSPERRAEEIKSASIFYKIGSIDTNTAYANRGTRVKLNIADDYLASLTTREVMTDDYLSHDKTSASFSYVYNSRLNLAGVSRTLFEGFSLNALFAHCSCGIPKITISNKACRITKDFTAEDYEVDTYIKENGETYKVTNKSSSKYLPSLPPYLSSAYSTETAISWGTYIFYPNANAYKMVIRSDSGSYEISLTSHDLLNGAFAVLEYDAIRNATTSEETTVTHSTAQIASLNKLYTSEVSNPFLFLAENILTIGTGEIIGIASAARPLSEGQFGAFPLYVFTTSGVWALSVKDNGQFSPAQPVSQDICINAKSIVQMETSVLFATERGVMILAGRDIKCITLILGSTQSFSTEDLPHHEDVTGRKCIIAPFRDFRAQIGIAYDYIGQRIILYNQGEWYAYVYSLLSNYWGMVESNLVSTVNSYPNNYAMNSLNQLVDVSRSDNNSANCIMVTRPLKLNLSDKYKTIRTLLHRGLFTKGSVKTILYGSRDGYKWFLVATGKTHQLVPVSGTPYKYFRIVALADLSQNQTLDGCEISMEEKYGNRLR